MRKKPKIAIFSLTSCEGCQFALFNLGEKFFNFLRKVELAQCSLLEEESLKCDLFDIAFIEGNPITKDDFKILKEAREKAKILVALGNCAALGGIPEMKNYQNKEKTIRIIYKHVDNIANPEIKEIDNFVKVDFVFPGCPINAEEFLFYIPRLLRGEIPVIPDSPVCVECRKKGNRCLLLDKIPCFGPMILGGCDAVCPTAKMPCQGCRGLRPAGNIKAMRTTLQKMMTDEEFENMSEIYGLRDDLEDKLGETI